MLASVLIFAAPAASGAQPAWNIDLGYERSSVTIAGAPTVWETSRVQASRVWPGAGGWFTAVERQHRGSLVDVALSTSGYRRLGDWTVAGGLAAAVKPEFLFRSSMEAVVSRRVWGTTVASVGYRRLDFAATDVHLFQPALTWNHARGEVQATLFITRKSQAASRGSSLTGLLTTFIDATPRLRLSGAVAYGERIFDVASLASAPATAHTLNGRARIGVTGHDFIEFGAGAAREQPSFEQKTVSLAYRRTF